MYLESRFRSLSWDCVIWFFGRGTWMWSLGGRLISHLGGSPTSTGQPKSMGARWNQKWLGTSICDNLKEWVFCCLTQTICIFLCLRITNNLNPWAWPCRIGGNRTTLKISCVIYFCFFYVITCYSRFLSLQVQSHPVATNSLVVTDKKLIELIIW